MSQKIHQIFKNIPEIEPTPGLEAAIFRRIALEKEKIVRRKLLFSRVFSLGSALATLAVLVTFGQEFLHSEFMSMTSLFFSDMSIVMENWSDFALSLMETLPTVTVSIILLPMFILFLSLGSYLDLNNNQQHKYMKIN